MKEKEEINSLQYHHGLNQPAQQHPDPDSEISHRRLVVHTVIPHRHHDHNHKDDEPQRRLHDLEDQVRGRFERAAGEKDDFRHVEDKAGGAE